MTYQIALPGIENPLARKREPRPRKGESWQNFCIRHKTWRRVVWKERTAEEKDRKIKDWTEWRERVMRSNEVFIWRQIERAKLEQQPGAVFFWFGGEFGYPGPQSQYVNQAGLDFLNTVGLGRRRGKQGKIRVGFGQCFHP